MLKKGNCESGVPSSHQEWESSGLYPCANKLFMSMHLHKYHYQDKCRVKFTRTSLRKIIIITIKPSKISFIRFTSVIPNMHLLIAEKFIANILGYSAFV